MTEKTLMKKLTEIAKEHLVGVETLEQRFSDSLDFHEVSVWSLEEALKAAYELGLKEGRKEGNK